MTTQTHTALGTIYRSGDREWFDGSMVQYKAALVMEARDAGGVHRDLDDIAADVIAHPENY